MQEEKIIRRYNCVREGCNWVGSRALNGARWSTSQSTSQSTTSTMRAFFFGEGSGRKTSPALSARKAADKATSGDPYAADKATNGDPYIGLNVRRSSNCLLHTSTFSPFSDVSTFQIAILGSSFSIFYIYKVRILLHRSNLRMLANVRQCFL